jgi:GNAT superfamily N-acetyltransferase
VSATIEVERRAVRAVPAVESATIEGWHVPIGRGQVRRMNAVTTFGTLPWEPIEAIEAVERRYRSRHRPVCFRLTHLDDELDDLLFARGYEKSSEVGVWTTSELPAVDPELTPILAVTPGWLELFGRLSGHSDLRVAEIGESLSSLALTHGVFRLADEAVGLAVVDSGWIGLFDIAVEEKRRRQGAGRRISLGMLGWGATHGATNAYLQVLADNIAATTLYQRLGFTELYRYWYRTLS